MTDDTIQLAHGSGGKKSHELIHQLFLPFFNNPYLNKLNDQAVLNCGGKRLSFSTDTYVVDPIFFPGGNIGELAVNGTVNDVCMCGARPFFLSAGFIIEEGFSIEELRAIVKSMQEAAKRANVLIVTGDVKVVNRGKGDKVFINTTGIGFMEHDLELSSEKLKPGDAVLLSGSIGDHGMAILSLREGLSFETTIKSDTAPLNGLVEEIIKAGGRHVRAMRDPTRGGLAATLNEFAEASKVGIHIMEDSLPVNPAVLGACEILGIDPLYVANEGKLVAVVAPEGEEAVLRAMRAHPLGKETARIGEAGYKNPGMVDMLTKIGGRRIVDMPVGEQLPRIC
ncbi:MAG: hydrogenase expression/formation protein HypE [Nitrospinae bacterium]|nr:hydrogenase expression/formation protein HypE [Nitrospinota bacterium]